VETQNLNFFLPCVRKVTRLQIIPLLILVTTLSERTPAFPFLLGLRQIHTNVSVCEMARPDLLQLHENRETIIQCNLISLRSDSHVLVVWNLHGVVFNTKLYSNQIYVYVSQELSFFYLVRAASATFVPHAGNIKFKYNLKYTDNTK
jgi:hypothetical protein